MKTHVNYTLVGLFVILFGVAFVAAAMWIGFSQPGREYNHFYVDMTESVSGLGEDAPVKYRGVTIGRVIAIDLDLEHPDRVRIELLIDKTIPIREGTIAFLESQGLTGIAFLNLNGGDPAAPLLLARRGEKYPVIPSGPSLFTRLDTGMTRLVTSLTATSDDVRALLSEPNREALGRVLGELESVLAALRTQAESMDLVMADVRHAMDRTAEASDQLPALFKKAEESLEGFDTLLDDVSRSADGASAFSVDLRMTAAELRSVLQRLEGTLEELGDDPSVFAFGRKSPPPGPGERTEKKE
ncbi:MAG: MlaD family protein [Candidatus Eisenbacteria bacterium]